MRRLLAPNHCAEPLRRTTAETRSRARSLAVLDRPCGVATGRLGRHRPLLLPHAGSRTANPARLNPSPTRPQPRSQSPSHSPSRSRSPRPAAPRKQPHAAAQNPHDHRFGTRNRTPRGSRARAIDHPAIDHAAIAATHHGPDRHHPNPAPRASPDRSASTVPRSSLRVITAIPRHHRMWSRSVGPGVPRGTSVSCPPSPRDALTGNSGRAPFMPDHASPTSGDNSVDGPAGARGRIVHQRWTTRVHPGDRSVSRPSIHSCGDPPTACPMGRSTSRHTVRPARTSSVHTAHRPCYYCCHLFLEKYKKNNGVDEARSLVPIGYRPAGMTPTAARLYGGLPGQR